MGLFLQKTNIIRDYLEDLEQGRTWWPKHIWGNYAGDLADLAKPQHRQAAVACLNDMVCVCTRAACLRDSARSWMPWATSRMSLCTWAA